MWHAGMWHWGNIGSAVAGASAFLIAIAALIRGPAAIRDYRDRQKAQVKSLQEESRRQAELAREQAETVRAQAEVAREEAENIRLERRAHLSGWSAYGVNSYAVTLVTEAAEINQARDQFASGNPTPYVVLRVAGPADGASVNQAKHLREVIIGEEGFIARPPTPGETEALRAGLDAIGIPHANY